MTIEKIIEYVLTTPYNTNRAILYAMLDQLIQDNSTILPDFPEGLIIIYDGGLI